MSWENPALQVIKFYKILLCDRIKKEVAIYFSENNETITTKNYKHRLYSHLNSRDKPNLSNCEKTY